MNLPVDTLLQGGKYRIVRFINSGGFGCTYEAEHVMLEKRVAIKEFFVKDFCNRDEATAHVTVGTVSKKGLVEKLRRKFVEEAKALCRLQHPGIVRVSDVFEENGTAYFVMDYIDGRSLSEVVKQEGPLSETRALRYIRQAAEALQYVHGHNRLHLDIKPGNIMVDGNDQAVLIDFGASKQYDEQDGENVSTLLGKTPGYAPLEQMGNDVVKFLPATDIYALGATFYKLLTGITPLSAHLLASGEVLKPLPAPVSASTGRAIAAAMELNKNRRPQTMREFLALLDEPGVPDDEVTVIDASESISSQKQEKEDKRESLISEPAVSKKPINFYVLIAVGILCVVAMVFFLIPDAPDKKGHSGNGTINGHEYVDLGLSVKWATCNVGASIPSDYGGYYAWGEISTKTTYTEENSVTYEKNLGDIAGDSQYDAARANWGGTWRLPTPNEIRELKEKCKWTWTTLGDHTGYRVTGPNGNSIFLPAAGYLFRSNLGLGRTGENGYYWSSMPNENATQYAYYLRFYNSDYDGSWSNRYDGQSVRPVSE